MGTSSNNVDATASRGASESNEPERLASGEFRAAELGQPHDADLLLDAVADALALFDADDRLVCCNGAFLRLLGPSKDCTVLGRSALELLEAWLPSLVLNGEVDRKRLVRLHTTELDDRGISFDVHTKDGRRLRVTDRLSAAKGRVRTVWNLSGGVRVDESASDAHTGATTEVLELLSAMNRKLMAPLNAMVGFAQLMRADRREPVSARQRARLEEILRAGALLATSIEDAVDLARLESGGAPLTLEPVDPLAVLREVVSALEQAAALCGSSLWLEAPAEGVPPVLVDVERFAKIVLIFGSNAVKYNRPNGAVRLCVLLRTPDRLRVSVHDNGNGIPLERQAHLFGPLERPNEGGAESVGTGIALAKHLAELLGASVGFKSRPGAGSEFWVEVAVA